jgi:hypothetical protein
MVYDLLLLLHSHCTRREHNEVVDVHISIAPKPPSELQGTHEPAIVRWLVALERGYYRAQRVVAGRTRTKLRSLCCAHATLQAPDGVHDAATEIGLCDQRGQIQP